MNFVTKIILLLSVFIMPSVSVKAQFSFKGPIKLIKVEDGPTYNVIFGSEGFLEEISSSEQSVGSFGYTFSYGNANSICSIFVMNEKKEWQRIVDTTVSTLSPGKYEVSQSIPVSNASTRGSFSASLINTELTSPQGKVALSMEAKYKDLNISEVKTLINGKKMSDNYKVEYSFLPYYTYTSMFDSMSFIISQILNVDMGFNSFWFQPMFTCFNSKMPNKIKTPEGKEYIFQYYPREGELYIEVKEDFNRRMLKRHKIHIYW